MAGDNKDAVWKVRAEDGSVFGPASMATLLAWARDGRLAATHTISKDGTNWTPVASHPELSMDWIAEISPGTFFGPIHKDAMEELVRDGTLSAEAPRYTRVRDSGDDPSALKGELAALRAETDALRADFVARASKLEEELAAAEAASAEIKAQLETRDLEFEAERQGFKAAETRMQAELAKAGKKAETLAEQVRQDGGRARSRAADEARIAELEAKLAAQDDTAKKAKVQADAEVADARRALRDAETALQSEKDAFARFRAEAQGATSRLKALEIREESLRKLLQQISAVMSETVSAPIEDAEVVNIP